MKCRPALALIFFAATFSRAIFARDTTQYLKIAPTPLPAGAPAAKPLPPANINDIARFLAGMAPQQKSDLLNLTATAEWRAYARDMEDHWVRFDLGRLKRVRRWAEAELKHTRQKDTLFYPFSGPDFVFAYNYFPHASTYVLCGLEPVGGIPQIANDAAFAPALRQLEATFHTLFSAGYFVTQNMREDLKTNTLGGTTPLLLIMLARSGCTVADVRVEAGSVTIHFFPEGERKKRTLIYAAVDLSDGALKKNPGFFDFLKANRIRNAYVKADSYLLHRSDFSMIRNAMLDLCSAILQDDSGIPLRDFDARWKITLYGVYAPPLDTFANFYQPELAEAYQRAKAPPIDFGTGYHWNPKEANLMLAIRVK